MFVQEGGRVENTQPPLSLRLEDQSQLWFYFSHPPTPISKFMIWEEEVASQKNDCT